MPELITIADARRLVLEALRPLPSERVVASDGFRPVSLCPSVTCVLLALLAIATASSAKCS